ncbi:MAG: hypothetical protein K2G16_10260 [Lachnospiraceae bacterium]|nr:hypothetical protein [Lachnospiraceae bacterium]
MSYCVNCGVELDKSLQACPLCNTPVINPRELEEKMEKSSFPKEKGQVETVKRKDLGLLLSVVLIAAGVTCGFLNLFVFTGSAWSLLIIGACLIVWVLFIPIVIYTKLSAYSALLFDGISIGVYLYLITFVTGKDVWFFELALPIVLLVFCIAELLTLCIRKLPVTFLTTALYLFTATGILCVGLEMLIDRYLRSGIQLVWSAVVLTVCTIIDIALITMLSRARLRDAVRRRLHF